MSEAAESDWAALESLFRAQAYQEVWERLECWPSLHDSRTRAEQRRRQAWTLLALGQTEEAYERFWSCSDHLGARAGILVLTVLAGQMRSAMQSWQTFCRSLSAPPKELPDAAWHARPVALAALAQLARYPFPAGSEERGAAGLYGALLWRALGETPRAFWELAQVAAFYPPAALLRDRWMEETVCLPAPHAAPALEPCACSDDPGALNTSTLGVNPERAVLAAARVLLYPDTDLLQRACDRALAEGRWHEALESLERLLTMEPFHTPSLEKRWRLHLRLQWRDAVKADLHLLVDLYEREGKMAACQQTAQRMVDLFPDDERTLLKMCFLQARLGAPVELGRYGRQLLRHCLEEQRRDRFATYRRWLLRQALTLDDRYEFGQWGTDRPDAL